MCERGCLFRRKPLTRRNFARHKQDHLPVLGARMAGKDQLHTLRLQLFPVVLTSSPA